jgi:hypothetical protein
MSVDRQQGWLVFLCDDCSAAIHPQTGDWRDAWATARRNGWSRSEIDDVWIHSCPTCTQAKQMQDKKFA